MGHANCRCTLVPVLPDTGLDDQILTDLDWSPPCCVYIYAGFPGGPGRCQNQADFIIKEVCECGFVFHDFICAAHVDSSTRHFNCTHCKQRDRSITTIMPLRP